MSKSIFVCLECGHNESKWMGRCSKCQTWNSFEQRDKLSSSKRNEFPHKKIKSSALKVSEITESNTMRMKSNVKELDRIMGGGITIGSLSLIAGEPGVGKSTLLMHISEKIAEQFPSEKIMYISGEESQVQIASRCRRMGVELENILILHESSWQEIENKLIDIKPIFVVIDSVQTTVSSNIASNAGSTSQVKEITYALMNYSKENNVTSFLIGHITKDGSIAGPKMLEHMVDTVVTFDGDINNEYRVLRVTKNRFGSTDEVGIFQMCEDGLRSIANPAQCFLESISGTSFGRSLTCVLEGSRSLLIEIQALVIENKLGSSRRVTQGFDINRLTLLIAVIEKYLEVPMSLNDIYLNVVGGFRINSGESDLAVVAAMLSSYFEKSLDAHTIFLGEVGLTGEVRSVPMLEKRLKEIKVLKYQRVIISRTNLEQLKSTPKSLKLVAIRKIDELIEIIQNE